MTQISPKERTITVTSEHIFISEEGGGGKITLNSLEWRLIYKSLPGLAPNLIKMELGGGGGEEAPSFRAALNINLLKRKSSYFQRIFTFQNVHISQFSHFSPQWRLLCYLCVQCVL